MNTSKKDYQQMVQKASPNSSIAGNCAKAYIVGGAVCMLGQLFYNVYTWAGAGQEMAGSLVAMSLIFLAVFLTGIGKFDDIVTFGGAGASVPITGFANAMAAPAIEFKKEGYIMGVGAKMFVIAGPVIVYGTLASMVVGAIYYIF